MKVVLDLNHFKFCKIKLCCEHFLTQHFYSRVKRVKAFLTDKTAKL